MRRFRQQRGFTLVETMVALAIVAIALPAMVTLVTTQLDSAGAIRERTYAYWIAQNELTRFQLLQREKLKRQLPNFNFPEKDSGVREMLGLKWQWYMETENIDGLPVQGFKRVTVYVNLVGRAETSISSLNTSRKPESSLASLTGFVSDPDAPR